jgi:hypothetical protein
MISRLYRFFRLPIATLALVLTVFAVSAAPASAHSTIVEQGNDYVVTDSNHMSGAVCDGERDGNRVIARWYNEEGQVAVADIGGVGDCDQEEWGVKATSVRICEYGLGVSECSKEHNV